MSLHFFRLLPMTLMGCLVAVASPADAQVTPKQPATTIEFGPATLVGGQGMRINLANVTPPNPTAMPVTPCTGKARFLGAEGNRFGEVQSFEIAAGQSVSFSAVVPAIDPPGPGMHPGILLRAKLRLPAEACLVNAVVEVYSNDTGGTVYLVPGVRTLPISADPD